MFGMLDEQRQASDSNRYAGLASEDGGGVGSFKAEGRGIIAGDSFAGGFVAHLGAFAVWYVP